MKKITLFAFACAMFLAPAVSQAQQVVYVEDPSQGYTFNRFQDNWFIEAEGGVGMLMSRADQKADFIDRLGAKGQLDLGKWFSPILGVRFGGEFNQFKGMTYEKEFNDAIGSRKWPADKIQNGAVPQKFNSVGGFGDVMVNVTNWWMGYRPGRFYNAILYAGMGVRWILERENHNGDWKYAGGMDHLRSFAARGGLLNTFRLNEHININLDLRFEEVQKHFDGRGHRSWNEYPSVLLGFAYRFNKTEWTAPIVPVCPTYKYTDAEGDALVARLQDANNKIANLEQQLRDCLNRKVDPVKPTPAADAPLAIVYYPKNVSKLVGVYPEVVDAVAGVMNNETGNYVLTGWADNWTGNKEINTRLRKDRVAGVKKALVAKGVAADRLDTQINDGNLDNVDKASAALGRAVTINRVKK